MTCSRIRRSLPRMVVVLSLLTACEIPTGVPRWDTKWSVPANTTTIPVEALLPAGVAPSPNGDAFRVAMEPISFNRSLAAACAACLATDGTTVVKPAFTTVVIGRAPLPAQIVSAALVSDTLTVEVTNNFSFDPIRPSATSRGYVIIDVRSGASVIGKDSISGAITALLPGVSVMRHIPLSGTITSGAIAVTATIYSPEGDPVAADTGGSIGISAWIENFYVASALVAVDDLPVTSNTTTLDLRAVNPAIGERVADGALVLTIENPFAVCGQISLRITGLGIDLVHEWSLAPGSSTATVAMTKDELRLMIGQSLSLSLSGALSQTSAGVAVSPNQALSVSSRLAITLATTGRSN
jgi:hypothetical protein